MLKKLMLVGAILSGTACGSQARDVDPDVAHECARLWGSDYHMQLFCRKQQMQAKDEIRLQDFESALRGNSSTQQAIDSARKLYAKGIGELNRSIDGCYSGASSVPQYQICLVMDTYAQIRTGAKGRNGAQVTENRQIAQATRIFGKARGETARSSIVGEALLAVINDLH
ncbi:hypothetical protein ELH39_01025 [Rhizobium ruizarguesonis]|uniref:hypothetical protein n=1 Tax=Rhizobium ruizarguesonis TaxID=2081791 RepID=UPI00102FED1F|nr:hypothetical protein [Rhizobium ruizarguesonis]TBB95932.1 hypothetical protein ELH39_01025 [Rhizobium ruizarguesonis]